MPIAMVLIDGDPNPEAGAITEYLANNWPDLPNVCETSAGENTLSIELGDATITLGTMPAPVPWSALEGPCSTSILWKDATAAVKPHKTHIIVTVFGELSPLQLSTILTQATAAVLATTPSAIGAFWSNAALVVPKDVFIAFAKEVLPEEMPLHIWVDFRVGLDGDKQSSGFTQGMVALGHREFEARQAPEPPGELRKRLESLAAYVLTNGPVISDGDTVGEDHHEKIRVRYAESGFGHEGEVMHLQYEKQHRGRPWWKLW